MTRKQTRKSKRDQSGQAIVMVSLGIVLLAGLLGLVVDVGWGYYRKQVAQAAVDAAALAAVVNAGTGTITCGSGGVYCAAQNGGPLQCGNAKLSGTNLAAGCQYGVQNGIPNGEITMNSDLTTNTPLNGVSSAKYWVTAKVTESMLPTFLRVMGVNGGTISAQATAAAVPTGTGGGGGCLYVLDATAGQALNISGASVTSTCGIYLNSNNTSNALSVNGNGTISAGTASFNMVNGAKISASGSGCKQDAFYGQQNPSNSFQCTDPTYGSAAVDPLAALPAQTPGACGSPPNGGTNYSWSNLSPPQTIGPGVYCGGINIGGGNVTLQPGVYILNGGGLKIQGGSNTTVTGNGVVFYNTASGYTAGSLLISSQVNATLKAPTSGTYQGIFFMQDHNTCPSTSHAVNGAPNNNTIKINGTIYAHCTKSSGYAAQNLIYTGQSTTGYYTALVVDTLTVNGATNLVLDPTGGSNTGIGLGSGNKPFLVQ